MVAVPKNGTRRRCVSQIKGKKQEEQRAKPPKGRLLLGPGEPETQEVVPDGGRDPVPVGTAGVPGKVDPGTAPNANISSFRCDRVNDVLARIIQGLRPLRHLTVHIGQSKTIRRVAFTETVPPMYSPFQLWTVFGTEIPSIAVRLF